MVRYLGYRPIEFLVVVLALGSALVGLYIAVQAYRGVRRYESRQMLYLSTGMVLVFGVAYLLGFVGTVLIRLRILELPTQDVFRLAVRAVQLVGLLAIAYSLHLRE